MDFEYIEKKLTSPDLQSVWFSRCATFPKVDSNLMLHTGWQSLIGCLKLQVILHKRATNYRALLQKVTYEDQASYDSTLILHSAFRSEQTFVNVCVGVP